MDELDEKMEFVDVEVSVITTSFTVEYAGCGSHRQEIVATMQYRELLDLKKRIDNTIENLRLEQSAVDGRLDL